MEQIIGVEAPAEAPVEAEAVPQTGSGDGSGRVTLEQLAQMLEVHFRIVATGLAVSHPGIPPRAMWAAIAEAMGNVLSGATQGPDIQATVAARAQLGDIVNKAIRKRYPAIAAESMPRLVTANGLPV